MNDVPNVNVKPNKRVYNRFEKWVMCNMPYGIILVIGLVFFTYMRVEKIVWRQGQIEKTITNDLVNNPQLKASETKNTNEHVIILMKVEEIHKSDTTKLAILSSKVDGIIKITDKLLVLGLNGQLSKIEGNPELYYVLVPKDTIKHKTLVKVLNKLDTDKILTN